MKKEFLKISKVREYNDILGLVTRHPLISVVDFSTLNSIPPSASNIGLYIICFVEIISGNIKYGRKLYQYNNGSLMFTAPGQVVENIDEPSVSTAGNNWVIVFHPDLIKGSFLADKIHEYNFFSYEISDSLYISETEKKTILDFFQQIKNEINAPLDLHSNQIIVSTIDLLLKHSKRFYDRQYFTESKADHNVIQRFEKLLNFYFLHDNLALNGLPSVSAVAEKLNLSANYFGDIIKRETGIAAKDHIQNKMVEAAKEKILNKEKTISEIAFELGFKYPQHFMRIFKNKTGVSPLAYRLNKDF